MEGDFSAPLLKHDADVLCQHCARPLVYFGFTVDYETRDGVQGVRATCCRCWSVNWFANGVVKVAEPRRQRRRKKQPPAGQ